jgi:hypothetical protein
VIRACLAQNASINGKEHRGGMDCLIVESSEKLGNQ